MRRPAGSWGGATPKSSSATEWPMATETRCWPPSRPGRGRTRDPRSRRVPAAPARRRTTEIRASRAAIVTPMSLGNWQPHAEATELAEWERLRVLRAEAEYDAVKKDPRVAYGLWCVVGIFG